MRLFLAISLDSAARTQLARGAALINDAGPPGTRIVANEKLHLTLQFFGEAEPAAASAFQAACSEAVRGVAPFELSLRGAGAFPADTHAKVLWVGVTRGAAELTLLAERIAQAARSVGLVPEERELHPHVTLAYLKQATNVMPLIAALDAALPPVPLQVTQLHLLQSLRTQGGTRYELVASFPLPPS